MLSPEKHDLNSPCSSAHQLVFDVEFVDTLGIFHMAICRLCRLSLGYVREALYVDPQDAVRKALGEDQLFSHGHRKYKNWV